MIHLLVKSHLFFPTEVKATIELIDFDALKHQGVKLLLIDLDNTLADYETIVPAPEQITFLATLERLGFSIIIVSNNGKRRVRQYCEALKQPYIAQAKKPFKQGFRKALRHHKSPLKPEQICMIGDQLMTDVLGASRMGFKSILVEPLRLKTERWYTRFNRGLERKILRRMRMDNPKSFDDLNLGRRLS